jgi:hypothetical protein
MGMQAEASFLASVGCNMPQPLIVSIPHSLGRDEAIRRLKSGLSVVEANFGTLFSVQEQTWQGDRLLFRISALGQLAKGTIDVAEDHARLEVSVPWLLAKAAKHIQRALRGHVTLLLERK